MLEGIAKELEQHVGKVLSFYLKDCPDLHRVAIKVEKVTEYTVEGFIQHRVRMLNCEAYDLEEVKGTDEGGSSSHFHVSGQETANGRKIVLRQDNILAWGPAKLYEASTERMPWYTLVDDEDLNRYE